jgi:5-methylcytosine-specific restriction endonuclease McrA
MLDFNKNNLKNEKTKKTLLLNKDFTPVSIIPLSVLSWKESIKLFFMNDIEIIDIYEDILIRSPNISINLPSIVILKKYLNIKNFKLKVDFNKRNILIRDLMTCQYCGKKYQENIFDKNILNNLLTIDHIIPRSKGGKSDWTNVVLSCKECNIEKSDKIIYPKIMPKKPTYYELIEKRKCLPVKISNKSWIHYIQSFWKNKDLIIIEEEDI